MWTYMLLSTALWQIGSSITLKDCPDNLVRDGYLAVFQDKCYYFYLNTRKDFHYARRICESRNGKLASVKSSGINDFIWRTLNKFNSFDNDYIWIGLSDHDVEGEYLWSDGSKMVYQNFENGAGPNTAVLDLSYKYQDCVAMKSTDGKWTDVKCSDSLLASHHNSFVCEYSSKQALTEHLKSCPASLSRDKYLHVLDNACYYFHLDSKKDFPAAQKTCQQHGGGNLVSIKTQKVENFIWKTLKEKYMFGTEFWIGLMDNNNDRTFYWRDGSTLGYANFAYLEGSLNGDECVSIHAYNGKWFDHPCTSSRFNKNERYFICEYHTQPTPPTTLTTITTMTPTSIKSRTTIPITRMKTATASPTTTTTTTTTSPSTTMKTKTATSTTISPTTFTTRRPISAITTTRASTKKPKSTPTTTEPTTTINTKSAPTKKPTITRHTTATTIPKPTKPNPKLTSTKHNITTTISPSNTRTTTTTHKGKSETTKSHKTTTNTTQQPQTETTLLNSKTSNTQQSRLNTTDKNSPITSTTQKLSSEAATTTTTITIPPKTPVSTTSTTTKPTIKSTTATTTTKSTPPPTSPQTKITTSITTTIKPTQETPTTTPPLPTTQSQTTTSPPPTTQPQTTTSPPTTTQPQTTISPPPTTQPQTTTSPTPTTQRQTTTSPPTTTQPQTTTSPPPTTKPQTTTSPPPSTTITEVAPTFITTCHTIICDLDCGLIGYQISPETHCMICKCDDDN